MRFVHLVSTLLSNKDIIDGFFRKDILDKLPTRISPRHSLKQSQGTDASFRKHTRKTNNHCINTECVRELPTNETTEG
jgi:hypothetical protein